MSISFIGALIIATISVIFAVQNAVPITVKLLFWKFEASLAIVLVITFILGLLMGILTFVPGRIKKGIGTLKQKKKRAELVSHSKEGK
ncbi:LapA family protein [Patescibacteria group bacterium]|nr:LapA family protein [Patescibacteria group bacterium]